MKYDGKCLQSVYDVMNVSLAKYGVRIDPVAEPTIEEICQVLMDAPAAEFTCVCGQRYALVPCKGCNTFYCEDCRKDHVCGSGENVYPFEA